LEGALLLGTVYLGLCAGRFILASIELAVDDRIILAASALSGAALFGLGLAAPTYGIALATLVIGGLAASATYPAILSLTGTRFPEHTSRAYGYLEASVASAGLIGPALVGVLADHGLSLWVALGLSPLVGVALGVSSLVWMAQDRRR
jgi:fucose permease